VPTIFVAVGTLPPSLVELPADVVALMVTTNLTVMPREGGASSTPRPLDSIIGVSGILDRPPSRTMTMECAFAISRRDFARVMQILMSSPSKQRAQGMPGARCTRGLVCQSA